MAGKSKVSLFQDGSPFLLQIIISRQKTFINQTFEKQCKTFAYGTLQAEHTIIFKETFF